MLEISSYAHRPSFIPQALVYHEPSQVLLPPCPINSDTLTRTNSQNEIPSKQPKCSILYQTRWIQHHKHPPIFSIPHTPKQHHRTPPIHTYPRPKPNQNQTKPNYQHKPPCMTSIYALPHQNPALSLLQAPSRDSFVVPRGCVPSILRSRSRQRRVRAVGVAQVVVVLFRSYGGQFTRCHRQF